MKLPKNISALVKQDPVKALALCEEIKASISKTTFDSRSMVNHAHKVISDKVAHLNIERYCCAIYDSGKRFRKLYVGPEGDNDSAVIFLRRLFKCVLDNDGQYIVVGHNHPSGNLSPSSEDFEGQKQIKKACFLFGISDTHMIVSSSGMILF